MQTAPARGVTAWAFSSLVVAAALLATWRHARSPAAPSAELAATARDEGPRRAGAIDEERFILPQPPGYVGVDDCARYENRWTFHGETPATLRAMFRGFGFTEAQQGAMVSAARCDGDRCELTPPLDALESLSPAARGAAQLALARSAENPLAGSPYRWPAEMPAWSTAPTLSDRARSLLEHTTWVRGDERMFFDVPLACAALGSDDERRGLLEVIRRRVAIRAWVRVPADAPIDELARYWSSEEGDDAALRARFEAARNGRVAVRDLLPPMPRARLDTFAPLGGPALDCYWTALHFFDASPSTALPDASGLTAALAAGYAQVSPGEERFGDVVVFYGVNGEPIHAFNQVAGDLVFSKDGGSPRRPWLLERFDDVRRSYPSAVTVRIWRRRA